MRNARYIASALVVAGLAVAGVHWCRRWRRVEHDSSASETTRHRVEAKDARMLKRELKRLQTKVSQLEGGQWRQQQQPNHQRETSIDRDGVQGRPAVKRKDMTRATPTAASDVAAFLDRFHDQERRDPEWSEHAEKEITKIFISPDLSGVSLRQVNCRTTLCRLDVALDAGADRHQLFSDIMKRSPFSGEGFIHVDNPGDRRIEWYISRVGRRLPKFR